MKFRVTLYDSSLLEHDDDDRGRKPCVRLISGRQQARDADGRSVKEIDMLSHARS